MCENLHYESVYFKELHNEQKYYWPTIYRAGAAVVSAITSYVVLAFESVDDTTLAELSRGTCTIYFSAFSKLKICQGNLAKFWLWPLLGMKGLIRETLYRYIIAAGHTKSVWTNHDLRNKSNKSVAYKSAKTAEWSTVYTIRSNVLIIMTGRHKERLSSSYLFYNNKTESGINTNFAVSIDWESELLRLNISNCLEGKGREN